MVTVGRPKILAAYRSGKLTGLPSSGMNAIPIRRATAADFDHWMLLIDALAAYEQLPGPTEDARARLRNDAFGAKPRLQVFLAELDDRPVGYALTFETYSSFLAQPTLYLEDLFVLPEYRRRGLGRALFRFLAGEARARGCGRMEWAVLDWNQSAIDFYEGTGARRITEWHVYRLTGDQLEKLAAG
jgi:GNAT superfamily N-acetyltransferase